jgi:hypothetical protein
MRREIGVLLLLVAGCSKTDTDPATARLQAGSGVVVVSSSDHDLSVLEPGLRMVRVGTLATVASDEKPDLAGPGTRDVQVQIKEGEYRGQVGTMNRRDLRPVPAK